jgi:hypothetical protein
MDNRGIAARFPAGARDSSLLFSMGTLGKGGRGVKFATRLRIVTSLRCIQLQLYLCKCVNDYVEFKILLL